MELAIRPISPSEFDAVWDIFREVVAEGDTYPYLPDTPKEQARKLWCPEGTRTYVASLDSKVVGTFYLRPNQPGLGSHVANAGFMVKKELRSRGIGRAMGEYAISEALRLGYKAMQFNLVVSRNVKSVELWKHVGFSVIGTIPKAFHYKQDDYVDALIMYKDLTA
jgi:L-amino acid N-acyltransferase YncA